VSGAEVCPLCAGEEASDAGAVPTAPLEAFWARYGVDLRRTFPDLPAELRHLRCRACGLHRFHPAPVAPPFFYERLATWPDYYRGDAWEWPVALEILREMKARRLLEIGCGNGDFLVRARDVVPTVEGLESNETAAAAARSRGLSVTSAALGDVAGEWDAIAAFQVLEHVPDPAGFLRQYIDRLAPGGLLLLATPNQDGFMGDLVGDWLNRPPHHVTLWRRSSFEAAARRFGLELVAYRVEPLRPEQYRLWLLRARKPSTSSLGKLVNLACRTAAAVTAQLGYANARNRLAGATHLVAFRKPA
jgi:SAM-dependent methyltransferase